MNHMVEEAGQAAAPAQATAKPRAAKAPRAAAKPAAKPAAKATVKSAAKADAKPAAKPVAKPAEKPAAKAVARAKPAKPATKVEAKPAAPAKAAKVKLVRDSFTMPSDEYAVLGLLKQRALAAAHHAKKSELLRAGVKLLASLDNAALLRALTAVPAVKTGRPKAKKGD
jgi:hypothetical protein